jgi:hypothetical protein
LKEHNYVASQKLELIKTPEQAKNVVLRARYFLQWMSSTGAVNPTDMESNISTGTLKERASVMYTLAMAHLVATPQEIEVLANDRSPDKDVVMGAAETVEAKKWAKMFEFDNSSVAINTSQRSRKTKSYNAFGSRIKAYKKEVKKSCTLTLPVKTSLYWNQTSCIAVQGRKHR